MKQKLGKLYNGSVTGLIILLFAAIPSGLSLCVFRFVRAQENILDYREAAEGALLHDALNGTPVILILVLTVLAYLLLSRFITRLSFAGALVGLLLGLNMLFSISMEHCVPPDIFLPDGLKTNLLVLFGFFCMCTMGTELLFRLFERAAGTINLQEKTNVRADRLRFWLAFAVIILCWLPALYFCYPGSVTADTVSRLRAVAGLESFPGPGPVLSTLVFGVLYQIGLAMDNAGLGIFLSVLLQVLVNGAAMALVARECFRYTRSRRIYVICILFFGVLPVWQNAAQLVTKEVLHTGFFLLFLMQFLRCIREPKKSLKNVIQLGLLALLMAFTRHGAYYIAIACLVIAAFVHRKKYLLPYVICLITVLGIFLFGNQLVEKTPDAETGSMQERQLALYYRSYPDDLTPAEKEILSRTLNLDEIAREAAPALTEQAASEEDVPSATPVPTPSPSPAQAAEQDGSANTRQLHNLYGKLMMRHPGVFFKAIVMDSFEQMNPWYDSPQTQAYVPGPDVGLQIPDAGEKAEAIRHYWDGWRKIPAARLLVGAGIYMWLYVIALGYTTKKRSLRALIGQAPALLAFVGLFVTRAGGEIRSAYPLIASIPLVYGWILYVVARDVKEQAEKNRLKAERAKLAAENRKRAILNPTLAGKELILETQEESDEQSEQELPEEFNPEEHTPSLPAEEKNRFKRAYKPGSLLRFVTKYIPVPENPKTYLDVLKVLAIYMVLWNHTSNGFGLYNTVQDMPQHLLYLCASLFDKIAVPLFFMASGALLLGREESWRKLLKNRVRHFAVILLVVSVINYVYYYHQDLNFSFSDFLVRLYTCTVMTPLWYLYTYLAFLLTLPFLRKLARTMREQDYFWLLGLYLLTELISVVDYFWFHGTRTHTWNFAIFTSQNYVLFSLYGFYIDRTMKRERFNLEIFALLIMSSVLAIGGGYMLTEWKMAGVAEWTLEESQTFMSTFVAIPSITVFYAAKAWFRRHPVTGETAARWSLLATGTFGTYLFERFWRDTAWFAYEIASKKLGPFVSSLIHIFVACAIGIAATLAYKLVTAILKNIFANPEKRKARKKKEPFVYKQPTEDISDLEEIETLLVGNAQHNASAGAGTDQKD